MRIAVLTTSKMTAAYPDKAIPESCTEILTDNPRIRQYAEKPLFNYLSKRMLFFILVHPLCPFMTRTS